MLRLSLVVFLAVTSIPGAIAQEALRPHVYPNPVAETRQVTVEVAEVAGASAELVDLLGRTLAPDAELAAGTYLVRVRHADGRVSPPASVTLATPGRVDLRLSASPFAAHAPSASSSTAQEYALIYVLGDSHAAGKGDSDATCALRPEAGSRGYVYQRSLRAFAPVCAPEVSGFSGSVIPSLVDEIYTRYGKIALVVSYTVKGSVLTPEARPGNPLYWYVGDRLAPKGDAFGNAQIQMKRARRTARRDFDETLEPVAAIHSVGLADSRKFLENGAPTASVFQSRLQSYDGALAQYGVPAYYFEIARIQPKPAYDEANAAFHTAMEAVVPAERIATYAEHTIAEHLASGDVYDDAMWYADKSGHLGALGLDYLGTQLAIRLDL